MQGLMQHDDLVLTRLLDRAAASSPGREIVTSIGDGRHRETYGQLAERVGRLASALESLSVRPGDRVATFAWNSWRHLELYFGPACMGAVLVPLNPRMLPAQAASAANRTRARVVFVDQSLASAFEVVAPHLTTVEHVVWMDPGARDGEEFAGDGQFRYEHLLARASGDAGWPRLDEDQACSICFTSGTTGEPKGVVYSHRSTILHAQMLTMADTIGLSERDVVMPVVPMFHAGAWGFPYAATLAGAAQVFTGSSGADPAMLTELIESERVTVATGVPTVWVRLLAALERRPRDVSSLRLIKTGGAAMAPSVIEAFDVRHGVEVLQGWGMTETGTLASLARLTPEQEKLPPAERAKVRAGQGRAVPGIRIRVVDDHGADVAADGTAVGEIWVKGNWVASSYFDDPERSAGAFVDGWLRTGDMATVDDQGFLRLMDRTSDLVKSGGEWISTLELEAALAGHPQVAEAAVVATPDAEWGERPLAYVVLRPGGTATKEDLLAFIEPGFPKWWVPDDIVLVGEIPKTSVGKFDKRALRDNARGDTDRQRTVKP